MIPNSHQFQRSPTDERPRRHSGIVRGIQRGHSDPAQRGGQVSTMLFDFDYIQWLQGGPSGRRTLFVDIKIKVPPQY